MRRFVVCECGRNYRSGGQSWQCGCGTQLKASSRRCWWCSSRWDYWISLLTCSCSRKIPTQPADHSGVLHDANGRRDEVTTWPAQADSPDAQATGYNQYPGGSKAGRNECVDEEKTAHIADLEQRQEYTKLASADANNIHGAWREGGLDVGSEAWRRAEQHRGDQQGRSRHRTANNRTAKPHPNSAALIKKKNEIAEEQPSEEKKSGRKMILQI